MELKQDLETGRLNTIIEGIQKLKGNDIIKIDLKSIKHTECNYFIICHGTSNTQVNAIAQSVEKIMEENYNEPAWHKDGYRNAIWILLDYNDIMVHIFQENTRKFYNLENLWADAKSIKISDNN